jgi:DNA mismatch repair protein MutS
LRELKISTFPFKRTKAILFSSENWFLAEVNTVSVHVAKLAGMPSKVVNRASEILKTLEDSRSNSGSTEKIKRVTEENLQLSFFQLDDPVLENIREELTKIDINTLTPIEALMKLNAIKKMIGK